MRVAMIVPVPRTPGATEEALLDRTWASVEHARALARTGADVRLFLEGPWRHEVALGDGAVARFVTARTRSMHPLVVAAARWRPDVMHLFHFREPTALMAAAAIGRVVVAEYNGGQPSSRAWVREAMRVATRRLRAVVFTSAEIARPFYSSRSLSSRPRLFELPEISSRLFLAPDRSRARAKLGVTGEPLVLIVGRREPPKDPHCALDAFFRIAEQRPDARLHWATWGGSEGPRIDERIGNDDRIVVEHNVDPYRMSDLYAAADVMLHTSRREICGTAFIEALQAGCPIAASDIPSFRTNGIAGAVRLCPVSNAEAFAAAAMALAADPDARGIARRHFVEQLSFDAIAKRRRALYETAVCSNS